MISHDYVLEVETNGIQITGRVCPYVWMYPKLGQRVEASFTDPYGGRHFRTARISWEDFTVEDFIALAKQINPQPCPKCAKTALLGETEHRPEGWCEACWKVKFDAKWEKILAQEAKKQAKRDAKRKKLGYTHKTVMWVHPKQGGDDYSLEMYTMKAPSEAEVVKLLTKRGSCRTDDWATEVIA
jgi:hypothetical protein